MMKCLERIIKSRICEQVKNHVLDGLQFAYTSKRCVEDATLTIIDCALKHLENINTKDSKYFVKVLFVDFSSAFNTIQPHILMQKLNTMNVNSHLVLWIHEYLTCRPQYVKFLNVCSDTLITNTGAPQGCVLSPSLFTLYTSDCKCRYDNCKLIKYADHTALVSLCINNDILYREEVTNFTNCCSDNYLELNVGKTKEMIIDYSTLGVKVPSLIINNEQVEIVNEYKYLGTILDNKFTFTSNVNAIYKKAN